MPKRILLVGTDTTHRHYIINTLLGRGLPLAACLFETEKVSPPFPVGPCFEQEEDEHLRETLFKDVPYDVTGIPSHTVPTANHPEARSLIRDIAPDIALVSGAGRIRPETIALFPDGLLNIHLGDAEAYRGLDTNLWAIYHSDWDRVAVTLHRIDEELDTGDIVSVRRVPLEDVSRLHELRTAETIVAAGMAVSALTAYLAGTLAARPQARRGRYYSFMPRDLRVYLKNRYDKGATPAVRI
jgi:Methionyl-tRNA formyltransferase